MYAIDPIIVSLIVFITTSKIAGGPVTTTESTFPSFSRFSRDIVSFTNSLVGIEAQTHAVFGNVLAILEAADLNSKDVDLAVQAADNARKSWSSLSIDERAQWLGKIAALGP